MELCLKRGIVLLNMGGPNNPDEVEMFLRNMFADKYILQTNGLMRFLVGSIIVKKRLKGFVLFNTPLLTGHLRVTHTHELRPA